MALDKRTGKERWRANRDEIDTWATPLIVEHDGRAQVITPAIDRVSSYDLETGEIIWQSRGTTMNAIPSPVHADGIVYVTTLNAVSPLPTLARGYAVVTDARSRTAITSVQDVEPQQALVTQLGDGQILSTVDGVNEVILDTDDIQR